MILCISKVDACDKTRNTKQSMKKNLNFIIKPLWFALLVLASYTAVCKNHIRVSSTNVSNKFSLAFITKITPELFSLYASKRPHLPHFVYSQILLLKHMHKLIRLKLLSAWHTSAWKVTTSLSFCLASMKLKGIWLACGESFPNNNNNNNKKSKNNIFFAIDHLPRNDVDTFHTLINTVRLCGQFFLYQLV